MLTDATERRKAARSIVAEARRGEDGDALGALDPLSVKMFRNARVNLQVPVVDPAVARWCLLFLAEECHHLIAEMDRLSDKRSQSLLVQSKLKRWNWAFARKAGMK